jgi:hypothetical protein
MRLRSLVLIPFAAALLYACSDEPEATTPEGYADVLYLGTVTDEALVAFVGALEQGPPADVPAKAPTLDAPTTGAALPKSPAPVFSWHIGATSSHNSPVPLHEVDDRALWVAPSPAPRAASTSKPWRFIGPLRELFGPVRTAYAHGDPYTGTATYLVFSTGADPKLVRVLTSETSYTPDQASWGKLTSAGTTITLTLMGAEFENNRVVQGGGPFKGSSIQFTVMP